MTGGMTGILKKVLKISTSNRMVSSAIDKKIYEW